MDAETRVDGRRAAGERSRVRLLDAAQSLIAERGQASISLRDITDAAEVNVAAVSYHFGSKDELCREAVVDALRQIAATHAARLAALQPRATIDDIATALVKTVVTYLTSSDDRARTLAILSARELLSPEQSSKYDDVTRDVFTNLEARLRVALPRTKADDIHFRARAAMVLLRAVASGVTGVPIEGRSAAYLVKLFVPAVSGCLAGNSVR